MRTIFTGLTRALALAVVIQVLLAGHGVFTGSLHPHRMLGIGILLLAVAMGVAGVLARIPRRALGTVGLVVALIVLQPVLIRVSAGLGDDSTAVGGLAVGLHAVNAVVIAVMLGEVLHQAGRETTPPVRLPTDEQRGAPPSRDQRRRVT